MTNKRTYIYETKKQPGKKEEIRRKCNFPGCPREFITDSRFIRTCSDCKKRVEYNGYGE